MSENENAVPDGVIRTPEPEIGLVAVNEAFVHALMSSRFSMRYPRSAGGHIAANDSFLHALLVRYYGADDAEVSDES